MVVSSLSMKRLYCTNTKSKDAEINSPKKVYLPKSTYVADVRRIGCIEGAFWVLLMTKISHPWLPLCWV